MRYCRKNTHGEIVDLARYLNSHMASLQLTHTKLHEGIKERGKAEIQLKLFEKVFKKTLEKITHFVAVFHDISEMKLQPEQIKHQAYHDALTGLPNRLLARDRLTMANANAKRHQHRLAVFFIDLDNFKNVNNNLGHATGDLLLQKVAKHLQHLFREEDTVARLGGDEFLILVTSRLL